MSMAFRASTIGIVFLLVTTVFPLAPAVADHHETAVEPGFMSLFDGKNISEHFVIKGDPSKWKVLDGVITSHPGGDRIMSKRIYHDFVLRLEWNVSPQGNSGVFIRVPSQEDRRPWSTGFEVQITSAPRDDSHCTGSVYGVTAVNPRPDETPDVWHTYEIRCFRDQVRVKSDGVVVVDMSYDDPRYAEAMKTRPRSGYIGLQDSHVGKNDQNNTIKYRNIRIQPLGPDGAAEGFALLTKNESGFKKIQTGHGTGGRWAFKDGTWSGEQDPPGSGNGGVILSERKFQNFEVIVETQPDWGVCSGFFLRSTEKGECYQIMIDYHGKGNVGGIYGEGTGGFQSRNYDFKDDKTIVPVTGEKAVVPLPFPADQFTRYWDHDRFNEISARCVGNPPRIDVWLNGIHITTYEDTKVRLKEPGGFGLQVHGGKGWPAGSFVRFRNLQVKEIGH